jgi:hypothetical protein
MMLLKSERLWSITSGKRVRPEELRISPRRGNKNRMMMLNRLLP